MGDIIFGLDIGTTKICALVGEVRDQQLQIIGLGISKSRGMHKGMVVDVNEASLALAEAIEKAEQTSGYDLSQAVISMAGEHISSTNNKGVVAVNRSNNGVTRQDIESALDVAQAIPIPHNRKIVHLIPRTYTLDNQAGIRNPIGMHGYRLEVEAHIVTAATPALKNLGQCVDNVGIKPADFILNAIASAEAVLEPTEREMGVVVADIGGPYTIEEGQSLVLDASQSSDADVPMQPLSYRWDIGADGVYDFDTGNFPTLSVPWSQFGVVDGPTSGVVTVEVSDGTNQSLTTATFDVLNAPPVAVDDQVATTESATNATFQVLANDTDPAGSEDPLTISAVNANATLGSVSFSPTQVVYSPNSTFEYLPAGATASDTLTYTITDDEGALSTATVTVTISGENDPATISGTTGATIHEDDVEPVIGTLLVADIDTGENRFITGSLVGNYGVFAIAADGNWSYDLDNSSVQFLNDGE